MAWVICLISVSRRIMSGVRSPGRIRAEIAAAACSASSSSRYAASAGALSWLRIWLGVVTGRPGAWVRGGGGGGGGVGGRGARGGGGACFFFRGFGDPPLRVVGGGGVRVEGIEG